MKDHEEDIAAFRNEANHGSNQDLKNFASSTLSTLQDNLQMAKDAQQPENTTSNFMKSPRPASADAGAIGLPGV